jgi:hypothetical protein
MKYLAHVALQKRLAQLPESLSLAEPNIISGVMGSKRRDLSILKTPFHREYANCRPEPNAVLKFTRQFGLLDWKGQFVGQADVAGLKFSFDMEAWREHRAKFLSAWATASINPKGLPWEIVPDNFPLPFDGSTWMVLGGLGEKEHASMLLKGPQTLWRLTEKGPVAYVYAQTSWQYLWMLLSFERREHLRTCQNPDCPAPYFIAHRKDQMFCGEDCAHRIAVRRWWSQHGNKWRRTRIKRKTRG